MTGGRSSLDPADLVALSPEDADRLLDELERTVPVRRPFVALDPGDRTEAVVFGDTHGDWRSTRETVKLWDSARERRFLVGLGDYVDRPPSDCPSGSVVNALYLLGLAAQYPDRVFLLQGNHETTRRIASLPHTLPEEVDELWGPEEERYQRIVALLERGPIAATTPNGVYFAHAGFPRRRTPDRWTDAFDHLDDDELCEIVWAECAASRNRRMAAPPWGERDLDAFLQDTGLGVVLRGHDPDLCGRPQYGRRCLTLHTTRIYERYGGVIAATVPLSPPLRTVDPIVLTHLPSEGQSYDEEAH